jgi:xanthine dehydrogenase accessory factor
MKNVFSQLFEKLQNGEEAVLVTTCGPKGVRRELQDGSPAEWTDKIADEDSLYIERRGAETVIAELFLPRPRMIIFGCGHIALPLSRIASMLNFEVILFDDRPSFADKSRFPEAKEVICDSFDNAARRVPIRKGDYAVIVTRGHRHDQDCLRTVLSGNIPFYMGMIGSRRRVAIVRKQMEDEGFAPELLQRLHSPIGLSIGAVTPEEIAISILAETVSEKRTRGPERYRESYADMELMEWLARRAGDEAAEPAALVTVISSEGSTPREAGAKMAALPHGGTVGSIGGGCAEADVILDAMDVIQNGGYLFKKIDLTDSAEEDGMVCGGVMQVLIEAL